MPRRKVTRPRSISTVPPSPHPKQGRLLPTIDGPKIGPFQRSGFRSFSDFHIESLLDEPSKSGNGEGYVFKASIAGDAYVLKIFKFSDIEELKSRFSPRWLRNIPSDKHLHDTLDPFYAECRAYGRINEIYARRYHGRDPHTLENDDLLAATCYGYVLIAAAHERALASKFGILDFERDLEEHGTQPLRAIVKKYMPPPPLDPKLRSVKRMLRDLKTLHQNGLYPIDVRADNYRNGLLVDFGMAITTPSYVLDALPKDVAIREMGRGLGEFDYMIEEAEIKTRVRAVRDLDWNIQTRSERKGYPEGTRGDFLMLDSSGKRAVAIAGTSPANKSKPLTRTISISTPVP